MLSALSAFVATVTGKVVLGSVVAAASVGTLHAADVVDLPVLPDNEPAVVVAADDEDDEAGEESREDRASEAPQAVQVYLDALEDYIDCVSGNAAARGDSQRDDETRSTGAFDPREGCGERPEAPGSAVSDEVSNRGGGAGDEGESGRENGANARDGHAPEGAGTQAEDGASNDPTDQGEDLPEDEDDEDTDDGEGAGDRGDDARSTHQP